ncbi:MAG: amino acid ABC transporter substrate-binding protein [Burkholderiaceae bacterium]|nr:amino acid ABC transporter substrate-binding protein [Microbacteriaceae bacterium]
MSTIRTCVPLLAVLAVVVLSSCTAAPVQPTPSPTPTVDVAPSGDGTLLIGTILPATGTSAALGPAQVAAVEAAVREINAAGGVLGARVEALHRDSGDAAAPRVVESFADLAARGVDVIVGPSDATSAALLLPQATAAGIPVIATGATDPAAEGAGLLFRTSPSAELDGAAIAAAILAENADATVAVLHGDDTTSSAVLASLTSGIGGDAVVAAEVVPSGAADVASAVTAVVGAGADAVVVALPAGQVEAVVSALDAAGVSGSGIWLTASAAAGDGVVDGVRIVRAATPTGERVDALRAAVLASDPAVTDFTLAAPAYDATIAAALAASVAGDDGGASIAQRLPGVTADGVPCTSYGQCLAALADGQDIDYDGVSGALGIDDAGRVSAAGYEVLTAAVDGSFSATGTVTVG